MRFGGLPEVGRPDLGPERNDSTDDNDVVDEGRMRMSCRYGPGATLDFTDSDSMTTDNPKVTQPPSKAHRTLPIQSVITGVWV